MNKNFVIINYNTQELTEHCIMSINKFVEGARIYVFDNSDKEPFMNIFENVNVIDNTNGEIINFEKFLSKYPSRNRSGGKRNGWGSAKHAYTIEKLIDMMDESFVLLDSDVLLKRDVSELFDDSVIWCGEISLQPNKKTHRVLPYICFINVGMCKRKGIHYFDDKHMHGLYYGGRVSADTFDTGAWFYLVTTKLPHKEIKCEDYVAHYGHGSWVKESGKKTNESEFLEQYKEYWI